LECNRLLERKEAQCIQNIGQEQALTTGKAARRALNSKNITIGSSKISYVT
jgi:hypothetical protein